MEYLYDNDTDSFVKVMSFEEEFYKIVEAFGGFEAYEKALTEETVINDDDELPW